MTDPSDRLPNCQEAWQQTVDVSVHDEWERVMKPRQTTLAFGRYWIVLMREGRYKEKRSRNGTHGGVLVFYVFFPSFFEPLYFHPCRTAKRSQALQDLVSDKLFGRHPSSWLIKTRRFGDWNLPPS
jgi:hypothetical protein